MAAVVSVWTGLVSQSGPISASGFNPWWEKLRSLCFYALVVIDLSIYYITDDFSPVKCTPSGEKKFNMSLSDINFVNSVCYGQIDIIFRYSGRYVLIGCAVIYIAYSWWEYVPVVNSRFSTVKRVDAILEQCHLAKSEILTLVRTPRSPPLQDKEGHLNTGLNHIVRDVCRRLFYLKDVGASLFFIYMIRNGVAMLIVGAAAWRAWSFYEKSIVQCGPNFSCSLDKESATTLGVTDFLCSNHLPSLLAFYFFAIFLVLLLMGLMTGIGVLLSVIAYFRMSISQKASSNVKTLIKDYAFVKLFSRHSTRLHRSTKKALDMLNDVILTKMYHNLTDAIRFSDKHFIRLFWRLANKGKVKVIKKIESVINEEDEDLKKKLGAMLKDFHELFKKILVHKKYRTFVHLHHLLFFVNDLPPNFEGCCSDLVIDKEVFSKEEFLFELLKHLGTPNMKVIQHIFLQADITEEEKEKMTRTPKSKAFRDLTFSELREGLKNLGVIHEQFDLISELEQAGCQDDSNQPSTSFSHCWRALVAQWLECWPGMPLGAPPLEESFGWLSPPLEESSVGCPWFKSPQPSTSSTSASPSYQQKSNGTKKETKVVWRKISKETGCQDDLNQPSTSSASGTSSHQPQIIGTKKMTKNVGRQKPDEENQPSTSTASACPGIQSRQKQSFMTKKETKTVRRNKAKKKPGDINVTPLLNYSERREMDPEDTREDLAACTQI